MNIDYTYAAAALVNIKRLKDLKIYTRHTETAPSGKIAFNAYINITITLLLFLLSMLRKRIYVDPYIINN